MTYSEYRFAVYGSNYDISFKLVFFYLYIFFVTF